MQELKAQLEALKETPAPAPAPAAPKPAPTSVPDDDELERRAAAIEVLCVLGEGWVWTLLRLIASEWAPRLAYVRG